MVAEEAANQERVEGMVDAAQHRIQQLEHRVEIARSATFKEIKDRIEEMLEDARQAWCAMTDMVEIHRLQGAERTLRALIAYYDTAIAQLRELRSHMDGAEGNG